ncbi:MAG TPA: hypothetical protein VFG22_10275 [Polyangiales bacterium]|nr:hypothetical protein [Polyangiales bacterium]
MALLAGTATTPNSLAKAIYDATVVEFGTVAGDLDTDRQRMCKAIAVGIVNHIAVFADVRISTSDAGLQRDNTGGNPATLAPSTDVVLAGAVE